MKESFYFSHDYNARNDQKILMIRSKFGLAGYALFWMCIESMAEDTNGYINRDAIGGLSVAYGLPNGHPIGLPNGHPYGLKQEAIFTLENFIDYCIEIKIFSEITDEKGNKNILSKRLLKHKEFRSILSTSGKKGAIARWEENSHPISHPNGEAYGKESKVKKSIVKKTKVGNPSEGSVSDQKEETTNDSLLSLLDSDPPSGNPEDSYTTPTGEFDYGKYIDDMIKNDKNFHVRIIACYLQMKDLKFFSKEDVSKAIIRNSRIAMKLTSYPIDAIDLTAEFLCNDKYWKNEWTLETIQKYINDPRVYQKK